MNNALKNWQRIILTSIALLLLALMTMGADPGHLARSIDPDTFQAGNYTFTGNLTVGSPNKEVLFVDNSSGKINMPGNVTIGNLTMTGSLNMSTTGINFSGGGVIYGKSNGELWYVAGQNIGNSGSGVVCESSVPACRTIGRLYTNTGFGSGGWYDGQNSNPRINLAGGDSALYLSGGTFTSIVMDGNDNLNFASISGSAGYSYPGDGTGDFSFETDANSFFGIGNINPNGTLHVSTPTRRNVLIVNASNSQIGIWTEATPNSTLEINGTLKISPPFNFTISSQNLSNFTCGVSNTGTLACVPLAGTQV